MSSQKERFVFECEHLLQFCQKFNRTHVEDQTDSILEVKLKDLETRWVKINTSYENVMLAPETEVNVDFKESAKNNFDECVDAYYHANSQILDLMKVSRIDTTQIQGFGSSTRYPLPQQISQNFSPGNTNVCIKVPPCDTEVFSGSYEEWPSFRDMFTAVYVNHPKLTRVQKLFHLRNKTKDNAGAIVKRYSLCDENLDLAWSALKTRYENKRVLVDNQLKILFNVPSVHSEDSTSIQKIQTCVNDCLATLRTLDVVIEGWDPILIYLISTKLPNETLSLWEQSLKSHRELPKWSQMDEFLINRFEVVERINSIRSTKEQYSLSPQNHSSIQTYISHENPDSSCKLCNTDHSLRICPKFRNFTIQQRVDYVFKNKFCNNCLASSHIKANCTSKHTCLHCKKRHHTLLHMKPKSHYSVQNSDCPKNTEDNSQKLPFNNAKFIKNSQIISRDETPSSSTQIHANCSSGNENILLRTALMQIEYMGELYTIRALIDPGSQRTFLSEKIRSRLQLPYRKSHYEIIGIGGQTQSANKECEFVLYAKRQNLRFPIKAIVLPKVTKRLPTLTFQYRTSPELDELDLADPTFNKSSQIDLILGNDYEHFINIEGIRKNICGETSAYNTVFGWVLSGPIKCQTVNTFTTSVVTSDTSELNDLLRKFWEQEELPSSTPRSAEDEYCEEFYTKTTKRHENGRYIVKLPFKKEFPDKVFLGSSRFMALGQYSQMEKTLANDPHLQSQYKTVLNEYIELDHMEETSSREVISDGKFNSFYLPHHAVVRPEHKTTKVRVVFNASRKSKSRYSLNDVLYTGPTLQCDLTLIILNWRKYQYVFSGDIQKMYRQILIDSAGRPFQRILFQEKPDGPIKDFELKTVTFGINCAPFLAIRTLLQLANDSEALNPKAASILRSETYVDDILSGGYSIKDTLLAQTELINTLKSAGFVLKKITANNTQLLSDLPQEDLYDSNFLRFHESSSTKTLGIKWNALTDSFCYSFSPIAQATTSSKRQILSSVAKLFDPAGWLTPVVIRGKILMQQLWLEGLQWDENVSPKTLQQWNDLLSDLTHLDSIQIPRWLQYTPSDVIQIHGFSDASQSAYCATVYVRCQTSTFNVFSNLLVAKSKVAPIQTVCLPRLELNGAVLLANLVHYVTSSLNFNEQKVFLWTDSSIVLGWISKPPTTWETYVANRVSQIQRLVPRAIWSHVPTHENPADLGTRGCKPQDLVNNSLWWQGPSWITNPISEWPNKNPLKPTEYCKSVQVYHTANLKIDILTNFSSYHKALRVLSYVFRFFNKSISKIRPKTLQNYSNLELTHQEVNFVKIKLIILAQKAFYAEEYLKLSNSEQIKQTSSLKLLNPFLDSNSILRVNGRLSQSSLPYNERYPIILPGNSRFCHLYLTHLHTFLSHAECNQMCRMVQTEFFISRLKPRIKNIIRHCKTCIIFKQKPCSQIMAPLPPNRCNLSRPFHTTGIDFAGPFELKSSSLRKASTVKGYASVFVCFSTKAVHLEACSDLSSAAFQAAFSRFVGRRGLPHRVVSDNGRNFLGASRVLAREFTQFINTVSTDISQKYITHGFEWKFIPPHAPHMGGLWEAAVKSFKFHLKRITGAQRFNFEEFSTILARIEGVLNSRPISAMTEDPTDLNALTPGHFLIGTPIMALPEPDAQNLSLINRWEKLKALHHQFSIRWKEDYLKSLHKRYKWKTTAPNMRIGDLVVVMDDLQPPYEWRLGRIEKTYPGTDNNVRIADVRISTGIITRPIVKLCYLPFLNEEPSPKQALI